LSDLVVACNIWSSREGSLLIYLPERLNELFNAMTANKLEPKRMRCIHSLTTTEASLVLVEAHRDAAPGLKSCTADSL